VPLKVLHVVGARPNFVKIAPILAAMQARGHAFQQVLVHTGQHYDDDMSRIFFDDLKMPAEDEFLGIGSGTHSEQTGRVILAFEPVLLKHQPDWVMVVGDVNSTLACALVCAKLGVHVAHVEAGLRSWDRSMPEEINRLLTDQICDLLFTPSKDADANLSREGIAEQKIHFVGNVMIDTLVKMLPKAQERPILGDLGLEKGGFMLVTLHRPANVDQPETLAQILSALETIAQEFPVVFPVHPRTRKNMQSFEMQAEGVNFLEPLGYLDFLALTNSARLVLTDSGGIQEETTYLGVPCLTVRPNTERPVTVEIGTNRLVASQRESILEAVKDLFSGHVRKGVCPPLWDGKASERIVKVMLAQKNSGILRG
jgi:UDP-N-acetylglucosamine 2-epimerase (non-hydrolysing)